MIPILVLAGASLDSRASKSEIGTNVIHVHWLVPFGPVVGILRTFANFRYVVTSHGSDVWAFAGNPSRIGRVVSWTHRAFTFRRVDKLVFVSHALREALAGSIPGIPFWEGNGHWYGDRLWCLFRARRSRGLSMMLLLRIVFVGRLVKSKGVRYLLEAVGILRKRGVKCRPGDMRRRPLPRVSRTSGRSA